MTYQHPLRTIPRRALALAAVVLVAIAMLAAALPSAHASTLAASQSHSAGAPMSHGDDGGGDFEGEGCFLVFDPVFGPLLLCFDD
jgi:hypothetical protein